jgi:hypothetical protein
MTGDLLLWGVLCAQSARYPGVIIGWRGRVKVRAFRRKTVKVCSQTSVVSSDCLQLDKIRVKPVQAASM